MTAERIRAIEGEPVTEETYVIVLSPVRLPDGRVLALDAPQVVAFNLVEAQRHAERGRARRREILARIDQRADGWWSVKDTTKALDCMRDLASGVLFSYTALEGLGNHTIEQLPDDAVVRIERDGREVEIGKVRMERALSVSQKLSLVIPLFNGTESLKGDALWAKFVALRKLRDALVHPKNRGSNTLTPDGPDPDDPGIYGLLIRGDADGAAEDAAALIRRLRPEFLPEHVEVALRS